MLMRSLIVAAVSAVAISPLAAQQALGAGRAMPLDTGHPSPTPTASASTDGLDHEDMAGMNDEDMPGMNHEDMPGMGHDEPSGTEHSSTPGMNDQEMPGMDHGSPGTSDPSLSPSDSAETEGSHAHAKEEVFSEPRPTALLVGVFAAVNAGVMGTAFVLRRRERAKGSERRGRSAK